MFFYVLYSQLHLSDVSIRNRRSPRNTVSSDVVSSNVCSRMTSIEVKLGGCSDNIPVFGGPRQTLDFHTANSVVR